MTNLTRLFQPIPLWLNWPGIVFNGPNLQWQTNTIHLTLKMTSAQIVETSVIKNSSLQHYPHPDHHIIRTTDTPRFNPFKKYCYLSSRVVLVCNPTIQVNQINSPSKPSQDLEKSQGNFAVRLTLSFSKQLVSRVNVCYRCVFSALQNAQNINSCSRGCLTNGEKLTRQCRKLLWVMWFLRLLDWTSRSFRVVEENSTNTRISVLLNYLKPQSSKTELSRPKMPIGIVAHAFTLLWDNLCRNSCIMLPSVQTLTQGLSRKEHAWQDVASSCMTTLSARPWLFERWITPSSG